VWFFSLIWFTLCPFVTKRGSNCCFGPGMYFQTGKVSFVPEWPKGEFVSILALFCVWTKSLMCNDAVNRDSTFRVMSEDSACKLEEFQVPCQPSGRCVIPKHHLSGRRVSSVRTPTSYREASVPACSVRTFQQHVRMPISSRTVH
jgi:hypothetical protein